VGLTASVNLMTFDSQHERALGRSYERQSASPSVPARCTVPRESRARGLQQRRALRRVLPGRPIALGIRCIRLTKQSGPRSRVCLRRHIEQKDVAAARAQQLPYPPQIHQNEICGYVWSEAVNCARKDIVFIARTLASRTRCRWPARIRLRSSIGRRPALMGPCREPRSESAKAYPSFSWLGSSMNRRNRSPPVRRLRRRRTN